MQRSVPNLNDFAVEHVAQYGQRLWRKLRCYAMAGLPLIGDLSLLMRHEEMTYAWQEFAVTLRLYVAECLSTLLRQ